MKVEKIERDIQRSDNFQERAMGLAVGSESFVFNVLRKDLYSDPIGSLIREYAVNAQDEHKKYGVTKPIFIQVPSSFSPELHIRDYANGLTEEQVFKFFGEYGASDKRDSNDVVGFYGLGCKSAFAYTDSYVVKSFKNGIAYTFNLYIDETEIGRVAKISEEETNEPNGVLIIVLVKTKDINDFQHKVIKTVSYFKIKPNIEGLSYIPNFDSKESKIEGEDWKFFGEGYSMCIMGEIAYPINVEAIDNLTTWEEGLLESDLELNVNIGEIQVTASREALQMSSKTIEAIRKRLIGIKDTMLEQTEKSFAEAKTLFEVKSLYYSTILKGGTFGDIIRQSGKDLIWNGIVIDSNIITLDTDHHSILNYTKTWKGHIKENTVSRLYCGENVNIYFDDLEKKKLYKRRAKTLLSQFDVVTFISTDDIEDLENELGMPITSFNKLSEVVPADVVGRLGSFNVADKSKHFAKVFQLNISRLFGFHRIASEVWDVKDADLKKGGIFIHIERFKPVDLFGIYSLDNLTDALRNLKKVGININVPIYGVKNTNSIKGMISFNDWVQRKVNSLTKYKNQYSIMQSFTGDLLDVGELDETKTIGNDIQEYIVKYKEAKKISEQYELNRFLHKIFMLASVEIPSTNLEEMSEKISEKYPLLPLIEDYFRSDEKVIEYINDIDEKNFVTNFG